MCLFIVENVTNKITGDLLQFEKMAPSRAASNISTCQVSGVTIYKYNVPTYKYCVQCVAMLYNQFSAGVCKDVLDGLDLSWASLACIFVISIVIIVLNLILAR